MKNWSPDTENRFSTMFAEWEHIAAAQRETDLKRGIEQAAAWEPLRMAMEAEQVAAVAAGIWVLGPSDLLSVINRQRRETVHCAVLAWLLDPRAPHGLGCSFLADFLNLAAPSRTFSTEALATARPAVEVTRKHSRADLVVYATDFTIAVEAKVDALERPGQCNDLYQDWKHSPSPIFVFLTPLGRDPETATGPAAKAFQTVSFAAIRQQLEEIHVQVAQQTPQPSGLPALTTFLDTLRKEFP